MTRALAVVVWWILLSTFSFADACPRVKDVLGCPNARLSNGDCAVDVEWFAEYEKCTGKHAGIVIPYGNRLLLYTTNRASQILPLKRYPGPQYTCNLGGKPASDNNYPGMQEEANTVVPNDQYGSLHVLVANDEDSIDSCFAVNIKLSDNTLVDPHIIIKGGNAPNVILLELDVEKKKKKDH